jgi:hypothetical protein
MGLFSWLFRCRDADDQPLSASSLEALLHRLGYETTPLSTGWVEINIMREGWKIPIRLGLSPNSENVYLSVNFSPIAESRQAPAEAWLRLLQQTKWTAPAHFALYENTVYLQWPLENRGISALQLRQTIDDFDAIVRGTLSVWDKRNFAPPQPAPDTSITVRHPLTGI